MGCGIALPDSSCQQQQCDECPNLEDEFPDQVDAGPAGGADVAG